VSRESIATCMGDTFNEAEYKYRQGRIDQTDWDLYRFYWRNSAPRFSLEAAAFDLDPRARFGS
jgi:hypothetical protein